MVGFSFLQKSLLTTDKVYDYRKNMKFLLSLLCLCMYIVNTKKSQVPVCGYKRRQIKESENKCVFNLCRIKDDSDDDDDKCRENVLVHGQRAWIYSFNIMKLYSRINLSSPTQINQITEDITFLNIFLPIWLNIYI